MPFDPKCYELAVHFLSDCGAATDDHRNELAQVIQDAIEDWPVPREEYPHNSITDPWPVSGPGATVLTLRCACEDGRVWKPRLGGNDPGGKMVRCEVCHGTGEFKRLCQGWDCHAAATELVQDGTSNDPYCARCAAIVRAEISEETEANQ